MVMVKDLTETTLEDLWREVKDEDEGDEISDRILAMVKLIMEHSLEAELMEQLRVSWYKRVDTRRGYRNGHYERTLFTKFGVIKNLKVPRARESFGSRIIPRYQRRVEEVNRMVRDMFLAGVSTRRVGEILDKIHGQKISAQTVSRITQSLDREVAKFHRRPLTDTYPYLFLDGICLRVRGADKVHKRMVLCACGINQEGKKEIISFRQATSESEGQWQAFLSDLYHRGIEGENVRLVVTDGGTGLHRALETVYPYVPRQRCWAHKLRNVANKLRRRDEKECIADARLIYLARNRKEAVQRYRQWRADWYPTYPRAIDCVGKDLDELLNFLKVPVSHRIKVRTTNSIERTFREVRRRVRPMSCFTNTSSVERIIYGVISHLNGRWKDKPLLDFTQES